MELARFIARGRIWDGNAIGFQKSRHFRLPWSIIIGGLKIVGTSRKSKDQTPLLDCLLEGVRVKTSQSQDSEKVWMESVATSHLNLWPLLDAFAPAGYFGKMSPESSVLNVEKPLESSFKGWLNAGMGSHGEFVTLSIGEFPNDVVESSLSQILETGDVPQRYFLSAKASAGILRRAAKRGKTLPAHLERALREAAGLEPISS